MCFLRGRFYWAKLAPLDKKEAAVLLQPGLTAEGLECVIKARDHKLLSDPPVTSEECKPWVRTLMQALGSEACLPCSGRWEVTSSFRASQHCLLGCTGEGCIHNQGFSARWGVWASEEFWGVGYMAGKGLQWESWTLAWLPSLSLMSSPQGLASSFCHCHSSLSVCLSLSLSVSVSLPLSPPSIAFYFFLIPEGQFLKHKNTSKFSGDASETQISGSWIRISSLWRLSRHLSLLNLMQEF